VSTNVKRHGQCVLRRGASRRTALYVSHSAPFGCGVCQGHRADCLKVSVLPYHPLGGRQSQYSLLQIAHRLLWSSTGHSTMEPLHGSPHPQTWQLAQPGRTRNRTVRPPMPGQAPHPGPRQSKGGGPGRGIVILTVNALSFSGSSHAKMPATSSITKRSYSCGQRTGVVMDRSGLD
jgi:hypothetical protein